MPFSLELRVMLIIWEIRSSKCSVADDSALHVTRLYLYVSSLLTSVFVSKTLCLFTIFFLYLLYFPLLSFLTIFSSVSIIALNFLHASDSLLCLFHSKMHVTAMWLVPRSSLIFRFDFLGDPPQSSAVWSASALERGKTYLSLSANRLVTLSHSINNRL